MKLIILLFVIAHLCCCDWAPFPNYFGELEHDKRSLLEEAVSSIVDRIDFPYVKDNQIKQKQFFVKIRERARELDPDAKVYLGGGVIRSLLGYVYEEVYNLRNTIGNEKMTTGDALMDIIKDQRPVLSIEALGIGSDMDVYFDISGKAEHKFGESLEEFVNSAGKFLKISEDRTTKLQLSLVPKADVKPRQKQTQLAMYQGGSTMDLFVFEINCGKLVAPENTDSGLFFEGKFDYLSTRSEEEFKKNNVEYHKADPDKQAFRALRSFLELPFLTLTDKGETLLLRELDRIIKCLEEGNYRSDCISDIAMEQGQKMIQNARFGAANNRFLFSKEPVCERVKALNALLTGLNPPLVPRFALRKSLDTKPALPEDIEGVYVYKSEEFRKFIKESLPDGVLYHGTPKLDAILSMIRNGFFYSKAKSDLTGQKSGAAEYGDGVYMSGDFSTTAGYAGLGGVVLPFKLNEHQNLRILNYPKFEKSKKGGEIIAKKPGDIDINQYLAEEFGIDIVYHRHIIVMNSGALRKPKSISDLIELYYSSIKPNMVLDDRGNIASKFQLYLGFYCLGKALGFEELKSPLIYIQENFDKIDSSELPKVFSMLSSREELYGLMKSFSLEVLPKERSQALALLDSSETLDLPTLLNNISILLGGLDIEEPKEEKVLDIFIRHYLDFMVDNYQRPENEQEFLKTFYEAFYTIRESLDSFPAFKDLLHKVLKGYSCDKLIENMPEWILIDLYGNDQTVSGRVLSAGNLLGHVSISSPRNWLGLEEEEWKRIQDVPAERRLHSETTARIMSGNEDVASALEYAYRHRLDEEYECEVVRPLVESKQSVLVPFILQHVSKNCQGECAQPGFWAEVKLLPKYDSIYRKFAEGLLSDGKYAQEMVPLLLILTNLDGLEEWNQTLDQNGLAQLLEALLGSDLPKALFQSIENWASSVDQPIGARLTKALLKCTECVKIVAQLMNGHLFVFKEEDSAIAIAFLPWAAKHYPKDVPDVFQEIGLIEENTREAVLEYFEQHFESIDEDDWITVINSVSSLDDRFIEIFKPHLLLGIQILSSNFKRREFWSKKFIVLALERPVFRSIALEYIADHKEDRYCEMLKTDGHFSHCFVGSIKNLKIPKEKIDPLLDCMECVPSNDLRYEGFNNNPTLAEAFLKRHMNKFTDLELEKFMALYPFGNAFRMRTVDVSNQVKDKILKSRVKFEIDPQMLKVFIEYAAKNGMVSNLFDRFAGARQILKDREGELNELFVDSIKSARPELQYQTLSQGWLCEPINDLAKAFFEKYMDRFDGPELEQLMKLSQFRGAFKLRNAKVNDKMKDEILKSGERFTMNPQMFKDFEEYAAKNGVADRLENFSILE